MTEEINYFWLNCGYNRWNHNEPLVGQTTLFESGAHFNPSQGFRAFKKAKAGDQVIFCLLYKYPIPRDPKTCRMPSSA